MDAKLKSGLCLNYSSLFKVMRCGVYYDLNLQVVSITFIVIVIVTVIVILNDKASGNR